MDKKNMEKNFLHAGASVQASNIQAAHLQAAARQSLASMFEQLETLQKRFDASSKSFCGNGSDTYIEEVQDEYLCLGLRKECLEAIIADNYLILCHLKGFEGYAYCCISKHDQKAKKSDMLISELYDTRIFDPLPYLEVNGERILMIHQDSRKGTCLKGIALNETRMFEYRYQDPEKGDIICNLIATRYL